MLIFTYEKRLFWQNHNFQIYLGTKWGNNKEIIKNSIYLSLSMFI